MWLNKLTRFKSGTLALLVAFPAHLFTAGPHLLLELLNGPEIRLVVRTHGGRLRLAGLLDLALQLRVLTLQLAHLLQVAGQAVVQDLHGLFLAAIEGALAVPAAGAHGARDATGWSAAAGPAGAGQVGLGEAAGGPVGAGQADRRHACHGLADITQAQLRPAAHAAGTDRGGPWAALDGSRTVGCHVGEVPSPQPRPTGLPVSTDPNPLGPFYTLQ